jgi:hypothetical protein
MSGTVVRCPFKSSPQACGSFMNNMCNVSISYTVQETAFGIISPDVTNIGGGSLSCSSGVQTFMAMNRGNRSLEVFYQSRIVIILEIMMLTA